MDGRLTFCVVFTSIILLVKSWPTEIRVAAKQESGQLDVVFFCYLTPLDWIKIVVIINDFKTALFFQLICKKKKVLLKLN